MVTRRSRCARPADQGGNDYEIYEHPDVLGHSVTDPEDTIRQLNELFLQ